MVFNFERKIAILFELLKIPANEQNNGDMEDDQLFGCWTMDAGFSECRAD